MNAHSDVEGKLRALADHLIARSERNDAVEIADEMSTYTEFKYDVIHHIAEYKERLNDDVS